MAVFVKYRAADGFRWRFRASNNRIVADSGEAYVNAQDRDHSIQLAKQPGALSYSVFKHGAQWYWNAKASNGRIIVDGAEGYWNELDCRSGMALFQREAPSAPVMAQAA